MKLLIFLSYFFIPISSYSAVCLNDVRDSLNKVSSVGEFDIFQTENFLGSKEYTKSILNIFGFNNHLQGLVYHPQTGVYYISGGDFKNKKSMLLSLKKENNQIKAFQRLELKNESNLWHLGGINIFEDILIAPLEKMGTGGDTSIVQLLDISDPNNVEILPNSFSRVGINYGSADLIKSDDGYYLVAANTGQLDIYHALELQDDFRFVKEIKEKIFKASYIKLFKECSGAMYIANFSPKSFLSNGKKNLIRLFKLDIEQSKTDKLEEYSFECDKKCSFRGAVGVYQNGQKLEVISSKQNKQKESEIHFRHFR